MGWDQPKNRTNQGLSVKTRQLQLWTLIKLWNQYASNLSHVHIWLMGQNVSHNWHIMLPLWIRQRKQLLLVHLCNFLGTGKCSKIILQLCKTAHLRKATPYWLPINFKQSKGKMFLFCSGSAPGRSLHEDFCNYFAFQYTHSLKYISVPVWPIVATIP